MEYVWFGVAGVLGGVLGGMGMGGGTLLIPLLTIFYKVSQHTAQAVNLISFIPMAVVALIIHIKNKLVDFNKIKNERLTNRIKYIKFSLAVNQNVKQIK